MEVKICTKCTTEKPIAAFRLRVEKRGKGCTYRNSQCDQCEENYRKERYWNNRERFKREASNWRKDNPESAKKRDKERYLKNKGPKKNEALKEWRKNNAESVRSHQKVRGKKWHNNARDTLSDTYVVGLLSTQGISVDVSRNNPALIEAKRIEVKTNRLIKEIENGD